MFKKTLILLVALLTVFTAMLPVGHPRLLYGTTFLMSTKSYQAHQNGSRLIYLKSVLPLMLSKKKRKE